MVRTLQSGRRKKLDEEVYPADYNRHKRFGSLLYFAKRKAKAVDDDVDLGIHNPGEPQLTVQKTINGDYMRLNQW